MTTAVLAVRRATAIGLDAGTRPVGWLSVGFLVALLALAAPGTAQILVGAISDAYLSVSVFVAATLLLFYGAERAFGVDLGDVMMRRKALQVPAAALLGALPGCGGSILVVTQYVSGRIGFGAVVATLTATMGDAAFLLLAREPMTGLGVFVLGIVVGLLSGWFVERLPAVHPPRRDRGGASGCESGCALKSAPAFYRFGAWLLVPGLVVGVAGAFQIDVDAVLGAPVTGMLGFVGGALALMLWARNGYRESPGCTGTGATSKALVDRTLDQTAFVTAWVIAAFAGYELIVAWTGIDLGAWFTVWAPLVPLIAVLVGFVPGCGPQIVVTSLYLSGVVPLSAQLGNAIANDGDALFPAIAMDPRAAWRATVLSSIPALIVAYVAFGVFGV
ncbi:MAG: arsenic efflux protein [Chromatiales bacterium]|nr:arsenic efflux protein [Chromatiales bacterium]